MDRREYCNQVLAQLRRLTPDEREAVRAEIDAHMEDHICALLDLGYDEQLAEERTLARMGDPAEVGRELDRQYPLRWLVLSRIAAVLLTITVCALIAGVFGLYTTVTSVRARLDPWHAVREDWRREINQTMDLRAEIGSDVVRVLASGTEETEDGAQAQVILCQYDQSPIGYVSDFHIAWADCRGKEEESWSGKGFGNAGAKYALRRVEVQYGDPYVTLVCDRYGERFEIEVPLDWGDDA